MRRYAIGLALLMLVASCAGTETEPPGTEATGPTPTATTAASTTGPPTGSTSTTAAPATSTTTPAPQDGPDELPPTDLEDASLAWRKADVAVNRTSDVALATIGNRLLLVEWNKANGLRVRASSDGITFSEPVSPAGIPAAITPEPASADLWVQGGGAGAMLFGNTELGSPALFTSADGAEWTVQPFPAGVGTVGDTTFFYVPGGSKEALLSSDGGRTWDSVGLPGPAPAYPMAFAAGDRFHFLGDAGPVLIVDREGVEMVPMPIRPDPLIQDGAAWGDGLVLVARGEFGVSGWRFALLGLVDEGWVEYPVPFFPAQLDWRNADYWNVQSIAAGRGGVLLVAFYPPEIFDFWGEGFQAIELPIVGLDAALFGDDVIAWAPGGGMRPLDWSFDDSGTLTVLEGPNGDVLGVVTCDDLRSAARGRPLMTEELIGWPEIRLGWSPEGTAWNDRPGAGIFGADAFVQQVVGFGDGFAALVVPNGAAGIPDPPHCPLGIYPPELPFEVWVGRNS